MTNPAEIMRDVAAKVAADYAATDNVGIAVSWQIAAAIRAIPIPEPALDPREPKGCPTPGACSCVAPDPRDDTIARMSAELAAAREALKPFATVGRIIEGPLGPALFTDDAPFRDGCAWTENGQKKTLTWGSFRRARAILAKLAEGA